MQTLIKQTCCLLMMMIMTVGFCGCTKDESAQDITEIELNNLETEKAADDSQVKAEESEQDIYVYVCGQVLRPGVYCLKGGSRIYEALEAAGGVLDTAAPDMLNQAEKAVDGEKIYVPSQEEKGQEILSQETAVVEDGKININTADKTQLMTLPGIGEAKAEKIIQYREENGGFQRVEDIMKIQGIKEGVYENIKELAKI